MEEGNGITSGQENPTSFIFKLNNDEEPVIVINSEGFRYRGELVEDAGAAYRAFMEFITIANG
jgi:hypothetical protein